MNIRWHQRLSNFNQALMQLSEAVQLSQQRALSDLEKQGLIQAFEYTHELAWNTIKDFFQYQGNAEIKGFRDATREAYKMGLIAEGELWMQMIETRNQTSHAYDKAMAEQVVKAIVSEYVPLFLAFQQVMIKLQQRD